MLVSVRGERVNRAIFNLASKIIRDCFGFT